MPSLCSCPAPFKPSTSVSCTALNVLYKPQLGAVAQSSEPTCFRLNSEILERFIELENK